MGGGPQEEQTSATVRSSDLQAQHRFGLAFAAWSEARQAVLPLALWGLQERGRLVSLEAERYLIISAMRRRSGNLKRSLLPGMKYEGGHV